MVARPVPKATGIKASHFQLLLAALVLLTGAHVLHLTDALVNPPPTKSARLTKTDHYAVVRVGPHVLKIPTEFIGSAAEGPDSNQSGSKAAAFLAASWPALDPLPRRPQSASPAQDRSLVTIKLHGRAGTSPRRFPASSSGSSPGATERMHGPGGLIAHIDEEATGSSGLVHYLEPGARPGYSTVCEKTQSSRTGHCTRTVQLQEQLAITYRFSEALLPDWGRLDRRVRELVEGFLVKNPAAPIS